MPRAEVVLTLNLQRRDPQREHVKTQKAISEFDAALNDLARATERLKVAADYYRQRLEGTRRGQ